MTFIIAVVNRQDGVGKATACSDFGVGPAQEGKRSLLPDTDPQGSLALCLGFRCRAGYDPEK